MTESPEVNSSHLSDQERYDLFSDALANYQCVIIEGQACFGKSIGFPRCAVQYAIDKGRVACAEPRRAAAVSLAAFVAAKMGVQLGEEVGYATRDKERAGSLLTYCTTGRLLREMKEHPLLEDYAVIVVDEVDERSVYTDILLGLLKQLLTRRQDLKVVLLGTSVDSTKWVRYFGDSAVIKVPTVVDPWQIIYIPGNDSQNPIDAAVEAVIWLQTKCTENEIHADGILLLLATEEEVKKACEEISMRVNGVNCLPVDSSTNLEQLERIYGYGDVIGRTCIISTSIGQTPVIFTFVIDSGRCQRSCHDPLAASQPVEFISKRTARMRAEIAGVWTIRLYSEADYEAMDEETIPEVLKAAPSKVEELLKNYGVDDVANFDFVDKPTN